MRRLSIVLAALALAAGVAVSLAAPKEVSVNDYRLWPVYEVKFASETVHGRVVNQEVLFDEPGVVACLIVTNEAILQHLRARIADGTFPDGLYVAGWARFTAENLADGRTGVFRARVCVGRREAPEEPEP